MDRSGNAFKIPCRKMTLAIFLAGTHRIRMVICGTLPNYILGSSAFQTLNLYLRTEDEIKFQFSRVMMTFLLSTHNCLILSDPKPLVIYLKIFIFTA